MFVLSESGSTYGAVFQGSQVDVPKSSVAKYVLSIVAVGTCV